MNLISYDFNRSRCLMERSILFLAPYLHLVDLLDKDLIKTKAKEEIVHEAG